MANNLINHAYVMKPQEKPQRRVLRSFQVGEYVETGEKEMERYVLSPILHPKHVFHLTIPELYPFIENQ